ncbi:MULTISPECIES: cytochrome P450 [Alphaproteobacteria]|uniref:Cytochrome P450 n=2 Tax=Alphaproteobacteria TaxID=28211 RepID=A0A512HM73_9HYPH|nr:MULTISPECIES: cytochrome P450 [Alphaproteobacteria]GEO86548.1 cytochrome P450 [Ciceribacter naphthalenivorans]GLR20880.1 cytochrome P450 [Ciceribacter naphthalenivorans]GLT03736.1 cytochrome P450 [Sphingomonas psychrolutea]
MANADRPDRFEPPAPQPRPVPLSRLAIIRTVLRNPLELWGVPSYTLPWIETRFFGRSTLIVNDPDLIRRVLVENTGNYRMDEVRQLVLRPILRDGLLTAEGGVWKRSRKAMAPVFTPRHAQGFARQMLEKSEEFAERYATEASVGMVRDIAVDMTELTYLILSETLFSGEIATDSGDIAGDVDALLETMGRIDPLDLLAAPQWMPRLRRIGGYRVLRKFRALVRTTMEVRKAAMTRDPQAAPRDFLTLLLEIEGPKGLTSAEIEDNILTFVGAGHETTARALSWALYCLAKCPDIRERVETEIDAVVESGADPVDWLERMPLVRAAFEETLRLYPPAPSINRQAVADDCFEAADGTVLDIRKGTTILIMPWTLHRHELYWDEPRVFDPSRFLPENRDRIDRFQYLPFGAGPRVCIGATFALQEAVIALAVLMRLYRFDVTEETRPWPVQKLTTQPQGGLPMRVMMRPARR